jgi:hypothetical protein
MTQHRLQLLAVAAAAALLAGCGSGTTTGGTSSESGATLRSDRGMVRFAGCMRAHGINMSDPFHRPGHEGLSVDLPERGPATTDAYNACGHYLEATVQLKEQAAAHRLTPAVRLGLIHYAECMRSHAIGMLDPGPLGQLSLGNVPGITNDLGRQTPQFAAADRACRHLLPASVPDNGTGP